MTFVKNPWTGRFGGQRNFEDTNLYYCYKINVCVYKINVCVYKINVCVYRCALRFPRPDYDSK